MTRHLLRYFILLSAVLPFKASAQYNMLFTSDYDMPNSLINKIAEDSHGMLWIASENGLGQFNGSRFIVYNSEAGHPEYLADNFVRTVCTDSKGDVFVGSIGGLQVFKPITGTFTEVLTNSKDGIKEGNVNDITPMHDGSFLVTGNYCFSLINKAGQWQAVKNMLTPKIHNAFCAIEAKDGSIFVALSPNGVVRYDKNDRIQRIRDSEGNDFLVRAFCIGPDSKVYAGSADKGLYVYSPKNNCFNRIPGTEFLSPICEIKVVPRTSRLCIATDVIGAQMFDTRMQRCVPSPQLSTPLLNLSKQKVHSVYINKDGDIWMALYQKGLFIATNKQTGFVYIGNSKANYDLLDDHCVTSILQTHDGNIWATTDNGGLFGFTPDLASLRRYPCDVRKSGVPATILGLFEDSRHRVWYGSYGRGGGLIDLYTGLCHAIYTQGNTSNDLNIYAYAEDKRGQIWVATMGNGIMKYDEKNKNFIPWITKGGPLWTGSIYYDRQHDVLYCGTYSGIVRFSPTDKKKNPQTLLPDVVVYSIARISKDVIGFTTNHGLVLLTISTGRMHTITTKQGLPNDNICAVQSSGDGNLWVTTMSGLTRFNMKTETAETYTIRDGLQGNEFYKNASMVSRDGRLWFGGINGITAFLPSDVERNHINCKVQVVDLRAGELYFRPDEEGKYYVPEGNNSFTISFATLPLYMTHRVNYIYRMDEGDWEILTAPQNRMRFNNLSYGNHTLEIKTTIGGKETAVSKTNIYIRYPWFLKWWMVIVWLILFFILAYYIYRSVQHRRLMHERLRRTQREQELKETKLQFFINIVHDLRTPLTLISTPLQKLQKTDEDATRQHLYDIMHRNTDRLLNLTNDIMDLRKLDRGKMELHPHHALVSKLISDIVESMTDMAETRQQEIAIIDHTAGNQFLMLDAQTLEKILVNLISNALKYTPEGGRIEVEWRIENGELAISVTDTGIGIPDEEKKHIFERFYQVHLDNKHIKGTGIGLNLVKSLVELHKGEITVTDNPAGQGTRFSVTIPALSAEDVPTIEEEEAKEPADISPSSSAISSSITKKTILIVDDDDDIRNFLMEELAEHFNVLEASNGRTAYHILNKSFDKAQGRMVDLIVSDIMMPEVDGLELLSMIRKNIHLAHIPVILLTAKASDQDYVEGLQATADAYITKPFNMELLETLIINILVRQKKLRNTFSGNSLPSSKIDTPEIESADDKLMERMLKVINENLSNPDLTSEMLASEVGLSRVHMYRKLKELTNQSATNYIRNIRLAKAAELLRQGKANISEVAYMVGFRTPAHFSTAFKELYGMSPKEYMRS